MRILVSVALAATIVIAGTAITQAQQDVWGEGTFSEVTVTLVWQPRTGIASGGGWWRLPDDNPGNSAFGGSSVRYDNDGVMFPNQTAYITGSQPSVAPSITTTGGAPWSQPDGVNSFGKVAGPSGPMMFDGAADKTIANFYTMGGASVQQSGGALRIDNVWVNSDTPNTPAGNAADFPVKFSGADNLTIGNHIFQIGQQTVNIDGKDYTFGKADERIESLNTRSNTNNATIVLAEDVASIVGGVIVNESATSTNIFDARPGQANNPYRAANGNTNVTIENTSIANFGEVGFVELRNGYFDNYNGATVEAFLGHQNWGNSGNTPDGTLNNWGQVDYATMRANTLNNYDGGNIGVLAMKSAGAVIEDVPSNNFTTGNFVAVNNYSTIGEAIMDHSNGTLNNAGSIGSLNYMQGAFNDNSGYIGDLLISGDASGIGWGSVGNLSFGGDGNGIMSITGYADGGFDVSVANSVNLAGATLDLNLSAMLDASDFSNFDAWAAGFASAFGTAVDGESFFSFGNLFGLADSAIDGLEGILAINVDWGGADVETLAGWNDGILFSGAEAPSPVPEPATLVVFGLGLVGVGLASRRRRK